VCVPRRVQAADAPLLALACPDAASFKTLFGSWLKIPLELAPLLTTNTFILLKKMDMLPTSAQASTALTRTLSQYNWVASLTLQACMSDFLARLSRTLKDCV
jgi:hypothetical protein